MPHRAVVGSFSFLYAEFSLTGGCRDRSGLQRLRNVGGTESVGINRHETADERAVRGRASHPPRPRVMRRVLVTGWRSVDRGAQAGLLSFERNGFQVLLLWCQGGGKIGCDAKGEWQSDLAESREPGEREVSWTRTERPQHRPLVMVGGTAGEGKSVIPVCTVLGSRTDP